MFAQWQSAKRARDYVTADKLREELRQLGVDAEQRAPTPTDVEQLIRDREAAREQRDFAEADRIQLKLRALGVSEAAMPSEVSARSVGLSGPWMIDHR